MPDGTLTLRDIQENGGTVSDKLLEPFVVGSSDDEKSASRNALDQSVREHLRYLDSVDRDVRFERLDVPIISKPEPKKKSSSAASSKSKSSGNGGSSNSRSRK